MNAKPFLDTNILIYAFAQGDRRTAAAVSLVESGGVISVQILNEFVNVSRKKLGRGWDEIEHELRVIRNLFGPALSLEPGHHQLAVSIAKRFGFGIFDSLMVASAAIANCDTLYTEDLHHGQKIEGLTIKNPFTS